MPPTSPLSLARRAAADAAANFAATKAAFHRADNTAKLAAGAARDERINKTLGPWGGQPKGMPGPKPPTALETVAEDARRKGEHAENVFNAAQIALSAAEGVLLTEENRILNSHRDALALKIREAQHAGAESAMDSLLTELKVLCPPDTCVRLNQRFRLSLSVRELLDSHDEANVMRVNTPINELRGDGALDYEQRRAEILEAHEAQFRATQEVA